MISQDMLYVVDQRLRQLKPQRQAVSFGGISVVLLGDFGQLPPVGQTALYKEAGKSPHAANGRLLFEEFLLHCVSLDVCVRQQNDLAYADLLLRLRNGCSTIDDCAAIRRRCCPLPPDFNDCVHLYTSNELVQTHNLDSFNMLTTPKCVVDAANSSLFAARATDEEAMGLANRLPLAVGARVMLTHNICVGAGLVNGSQGVIQQVRMRLYWYASILILLKCYHVKYFFKIYCSSLENSIPF